MHGRPKAIARPSTAYHDMSRREREHHRKHLAEISAADPQWDIRIASLALEPYGIKLIPNGHVVHVHQDYRDPRQVSGSAWDGRKPIWRAPKVVDHPHPLGKLTNKKKVRCARRPWSVPGQPADPKRQAVPPISRDTDDPAAADAFLAVIGHLATPETKRAQTYLHEGVNAEIIKRREWPYEQPIWWGRSRYWLGGIPTAVLKSMAAIKQCLRSFPDDPNASYLLVGLIARECGYPTMIPRRTGAYSFTEWPLDYITAPTFAKELGYGDLWQAMIDTDILRTSTKALQKPDVSRDEPFKAAARLWNWQINNRHRKQMRAKFPRK
jgi:hypothetical protein